MYTYKHSVGRYNNYLPGYHIVDISDYRVCDLEKLFSILTIVIHNDFYDQTVAIELSQYRDRFAKSEDTIQEFLDKIGNEQLVYHTKIPKNKYQLVKWESMPHKGMYHYPGNVNLANDRQTTLTSDSAPDIRLKVDNRTDVNYKNISNHALFIVNGCVTRSFGNNDALYLIGSGKDYIKTKKDMFISALNFEKIGSIKTIPITEENLNIREIEEYSRFQIHIDKNIDLNNKTIWLSFNGQLCFDLEVISKIGDNTLEFNYEQIDCIRHYFSYKDYTTTPLWTNINNKLKYIKEALLMHNSFIIIIDNPTVGVELLSVADYLYPNTFHTEEVFDYPVILENSLMPYIYKRTYGIGERLVNIDINNYYEYVVETVYDTNSNLLYDTVNQGQSGRLINSFLLRITGIEYEQ